MAASAVDSTQLPIILARRGRAVGAMFFALFGGAWLAFWHDGAGRSQLAGYAIIAALTAVLFAIARQRYRRYDALAPPQVDSADRRRRDRWFHTINAGQWVLIFIVANVLGNVGLRAWITPAVVLIVGLHFLPLARLFKYPVHYLTGAIFILWALIGPSLAGGPSDPVICLGAGLVLWASALWGLFGL